METANYIVQWVLAGVSLLGSLGAFWGWIKAKKQSKEAKREAERAKEYASNANEANIAAKRYYEMAIEIMEKQSTTVEIQAQKSEVQKYIIKHTFCKTEEIAKLISVSEEDAFNILYEMYLVDKSITAAGQVRLGNQALMWTSKSK